MSDPPHNHVRSTPQACPIHPTNMSDPPHKHVRSTPKACWIHPKSMLDPPHKHVRSTPQACPIHPTSMTDPPQKHLRSKIGRSSCRVTAKIFDVAMPKRAVTRDMQSAIEESDTHASI